MSLGGAAQRLLLVGAALYLARLVFDHELLRAAQLSATLAGVALAGAWAVLTVVRSRCLMRFYFSEASWLITPWGLYWQFRQLVGEVVARVRGVSQMVEVGPPFTGCWRVARGGVSREDSHSWGLATQRYAYDLIRVEDLGKLGDACRFGDLGSWATYGSPVLAAAPGRVVAAVDGVEDNRPGSVRLGVRNPLGNYVVIDHGGFYTLYAHLRRGSVRVRAGQWVGAGEVIGEAGNSGMSSAPHLHFQAMAGPDPFSSRSIPLSVAGRVLRRGDVVCA